MITGNNSSENDSSSKEIVITTQNGTSISSEKDLNGGLGQLNDDKYLFVENLLNELEKVRS